MRIKKWYGVLLILINLLFIAGITFFYLKDDRKAPAIEFDSATLVYEEGMDIEAFKDGVRAYDNKDGDISERVVIEKYVENADRSGITVYYAASDKAGNVTKASRVFLVSNGEETEQETDSHEEMTNENQEETSKEELMSLKEELDALQIELEEERAALDTERQALTEGKEQLERDQRRLRTDREQFEAEKRSFEDMVRQAGAGTPDTPEP